MSTTSTPSLYAFPLISMWRVPTTSHHLTVVLQRVDSSTRVDRPQIVSLTSTRPPSSSSWSTSLLLTSSLPSEHPMCRGSSSHADGWKIMLVTSTPSPYSSLLISVYHVHAASLFTIVLLLHGSHPKALVSPCRQSCSLTWRYRL